MECRKFEVQAAFSIIWNQRNFMKILKYSGLNSNQYSVANALMYYLYTAGIAALF